MKIGLNMMLWTTRVSVEHAPLFDALKAAGFDGVEVPVLGGDIADYAAVGQCLADRGLQCSASTAMPDATHNAISTDPTERTAALRFMNEVIDRTQALGADVLIGPFYQPLGHFTGQGPTDKETARAVDALRTMADYAGDRDVVLAVEPLNRFECYFLNTLDQARELMACVNHPACGVMVDTFHANIEERELVDSITRNLDIIRHVHVSENDRGVPGRGHIPFETILPAIRGGGYDGWFTIEAFGTALPELAAAACIWRPLFADPETVYTEGYELIKELTA